MTQMYLVRHGQTEWSANGRHTSITDLDLTEQGVREAESLRDRLDPGDFDLVLCSPRLRARRTAELAGFEPGRLEITEDLAEWYYGEYEGRTGADVRAENPGWTLWTAPTPGGESAQDVATRLDRVIDRALAAEAERVICFAHGHALRALMLRWLGMDFTLGDQFPLETGTLSILGPYKDGRALLRWNS